MRTADIYLFHNDCFNIMERLNDECIDLVLCDLPYGSTHNRWDSVLPFDRLWSEYERIIKPCGAIILFGSGMFTAMLMTSNPKMWRYNLIWEKSTPTGFLNANRMPMRSHEDICVFYKQLPTYNPQMTHGHIRKVSTASHKRNCRKSTDYGDYDRSTYDSTDRYPLSVWKFPTDKQKSAFHPTQKPLALMEELVKTYSNEGDIVLDNCMGSGTTGVACMNLGRDFIGIEKEENYYLIARKRIEDARAGNVE